MRAEIPFNNGQGVYFTLEMFFIQNKFLTLILKKESEPLRWLKW